MIGLDFVIALFLAAPFLLVWGWIRYFKLPVRSDWRTRATVVGLSAPVLSIGVWLLMLLVARIMGWDTWNRPVQVFIAIGMCIPALGMLLALAGRPRFLLFVIPVSIATILFWIG